MIQRDLDAYLEEFNLRGTHQRCLRDPSFHFQCNSPLTSRNQVLTLSTEVELTTRFFNSPSSSIARPFYLASVERVVVCVGRSMTQPWISRHSGGSLDNPKGGKAP